MGISLEDFKAMEARLAKLGKRAVVPHLQDERVLTVGMPGLKLRAEKPVEELNKTEAAFLIKLRAAKWAWIGVQAFKLRLASNKCFYTPDFITADDGGLVAWEVKGFWRDDARVKIKVAAKEFPFIRFVAVTKTKTGWKEENFSP